MFLSLLAYFKEKYILAMFMGFGLGFADVTVQTLCTGTVGSDFGGKLEGYAMF